MKLLPSRRTFCVHYATTHQFSVSLHSKPQRPILIVIMIVINDISDAASRMSSKSLQKAPEIKRREGILNTVCLYPFTQIYQSYCIQDA